MKTKKSIKANLEKKRFIFFEIGLILALAIIFSSFELFNTNINNNNIGYVSWETEIEADIENTFIKEDKIEIIEPEPVEKPKVIEEINVVKNTEEEDILNIPDEDLDAPSPYEIYTPIPDPVEPIETLEYFLVEEKPQFKGGEIELFKFINNNVVYPEIAMENNSQGKVHISFVIDEKGKVIDVKALNDTDPFLTKEAVRVVSLLPDWEPGKQRNIPVRVKFVLPIDFKLY